MSNGSARIVVLGLSITSSWGNGHATTYRALLRELSSLGYKITFLERDVPWYRENRDLSRCSYCKIELYSSVDELKTRHHKLIREADAVILGSYVPDGVEVGTWIAAKARGVTAFYDIDTPVTVSDLRQGTCQYLSPELIPLFDLYLSFTGGPILTEVEQMFGAKCARLLACSVDTALYYPDEDARTKWELAYLGTYSPDRQVKLETLLLEPAKLLPKARFAVAGPLYPEDIVWPENVTRIQHLPPAEHRPFYNSQRFTLNLTRENMVKFGYSPSVRLFEAAACGTAIISDLWPGLETFFTPGSEVLIANSVDECCRTLRDCGEDERRAISHRARMRVLKEHAAAHRARQLDDYLSLARTRRRRSRLMASGASVLGRGTTHASPVQ